MFTTAGREKGECTDHTSIILSKWCDELSSKSCVAEDCEITQYGKSICRIVIIQFVHRPFTAFNCNALNRLLYLLRIECQLLCVCTHILSIHYLEISVLWATSYFLW